MPEIGADAARDAHAQQDRHHGGRGGDQDPCEVPACARERGVGPAPGPTFVKTFLRTYADYLGLDSRLLVEEYKQRFERPSTMELTPFAPRAAAGAASASAGGADARPGARRRGGIVVAARRALRARDLGRRRRRRRRAGEHDRDARRRRRTKTPARKKKKPAAPDACHPADRAHRNRQRLPRRRERQGADRQRDPGGGPSRRGATAASASGSPSATAGAAARRGKRRSTSPTARRRSATRCGPGKRPRELSAAQRPDLPVSARAGIVVTGTEVLSGIISDRNGPWLSERLRERGVELRAHPDRRRPPRGHARRARLHGREGLDLVVTSGGLGPTADDLTAEVVADFAGRPLALDEALEERIWAILERLRSRWRNLDEDALRAGNRKQALVPEGATVLEPVGTAPGLVVPGRAPTVLVLPGPAARAAADVGDGAGDRAAAQRCSSAPGPTSSGSCACSASPSPRSPRSLREIEERRRADRAAGDHDLPAARGDRDRDGVRARRRRGLRRLRGGDPRAPRRHAVLASTARRSTTR